MSANCFPQPSTNSWFSVLTAGCEVFTTSSFRLLSTPPAVELALLDDINGELVAVCREYHDHPVQIKISSLSSLCKHDPPMFHLAPWNASILHLTNQFPCDDQRLAVQPRPRGEAKSENPPRQREECLLQNLRWW